MSVPEKSELLENAYRQLSFAEGDLLSAAELPDMALFLIGLIKAIGLFWPIRLRKDLK